MILSKYFLAFAVLMVLCGAISDFSSATSPGEGASRVLSAVHDYDMCSIDAVVSRLQVSSVDAQDIIGKPSRVVIRRGAFRTRFFEENIIRNSEGALKVGYSENVMFNSGDILSSQYVSAEALRQSDPQLLLRFWSERLGGSQLVDESNLSNRLGFNSVLVWNFIRTPIDLYISKDVSIKETVEKNGVYHIESTSKFGRATITASEKSGWLPITVNIHKEAESLTAEGPLSDFFSLEDEDVPEISSVTWKVENSDFRKTSGGRLAPYRMVVSIERAYRNRQSFKTSRSIDIEQLVFGEPKNASDFDLTTPIPLGHPVTVQGAEHLSFKWDGDKPVPGIPNNHDRDRKALIANSNSAGKLLILANVALIAVLAILLWKKRRLT